MTPDFPAYWGPEGGTPIHARSAMEVQEGWVKHEGRYNIQTGQWEPASSADSIGDDDIKALRAAYRAKFGKGPFNGWDAATLREKIG